MPEPFKFHSWSFHNLSVLFRSPDCLSSFPFPTVWVWTGLLLSSSIRPTCSNCGEWWTLVWIFHSVGWSTCRRCWTRVKIADTKVLWHLFNPPCNGLQPDYFFKRLWCYLMNDPYCFQIDSQWQNQMHVGRLVFMFAPCSCREFRSSGFVFFVVVVRLVWYLFCLRWILYYLIVP